MFALTSSHLDGHLPTGVLCSVTVLGNQQVRLLNCGPPVAPTAEATPGSFMDILREWGGESMWEDMWNEGRDLCWVVASISEVTAIWVTDGSYH